MAVIIKRTPVMEFFKENEKAAIQKTLSYCRQSREKVVSLIEELVDTQECCEITITFKQRFRDTADDDEIMRFLSVYFAYNVDFYDVRHLLLIPEYGDNNNLHFHGLIKTGKRKYLSQLKTALCRRFGRTTIRNIQYTESYKKYLMKEQDDAIDIIAL